VVAEEDGEALASGRVRDDPGVLRLPELARPQDEPERLVGGRREDLVPLHEVDRCPG
jgi:hypothetical protein